jgi:lipoteichoic acid synthase
MPKYIVVLLLVTLSSVSLKAGEIEIRYRSQGAKEAYFIWGINDWRQVDQKPPGTTISNKLMRTPMIKENDEFVLRINLPAGNVIDYFFSSIRKEGPLRLEVEYFGYNKPPGKKFFHTSSDSSQVVTIRQDLAYLYVGKKMSNPKYAGYVFIALVLAALLLLFYRKYYLKLPAEPVNQKAFFVSVSITLVCFLFLIRAYVTQLLLQFLIKPVIFPLMLKTFLPDFLYAVLLISIFAILFFVRKKGRRYILGTYVFFVFISLMIALINSKLIEVLGKPFNFQWLYYSDFLKSTDASKSLGANIEPVFIKRSIFILLAAIPFCWIIYRAYIKKPKVIPVILILCLAVGYFSKKRHGVAATQTVNPVFYFVESLNGTESFSIFSGNSPGSKSEFNVKNNDSAITKYRQLFTQAKIKNVIVVVLESTPAEYVTSYNSTIRATPFLDSIKNQAVQFNAVYAHVPATNKSMVSFLCSTYPQLSFKSITREHPDIALPSLTEELKKSGYRTSFFNSGDNRYQNAEGFLKYRGFDVIRDYRNNPCAASIFTDKRYEDDNLEGVSDSCLSVNLFNWLKEDTSKPFFTMLWTFQTHYPYYPAGRHTNYGTGNHSLEKYLNALRQADETIRQIAEGLKKENLLSSTLIVVMGDHGEAFGRHGQTTHAAGIFEENLHIPLLFINPQLFNGEQINVPGGITDVAPSILSVLNKPAPTVWQGENLFSDNRRKRVYFFSPYSDYLFGFREDNYKFIFNATDNSFALYDLKEDPFEATNIAGKQPEYVKQAKMHLQSWMQYQSNYMDTLLKEVKKP